MRSPAGRNRLRSCAVNRKAAKALLGRDRAYAAS